MRSWDHEDPERNVALDRVRDAIAEQFNMFFGSDVNDLNAWNNLFRALRIVEVPDTIDQCKKAIRGIHVNICDLVDYSLNTGYNSEPKIFDTENELAECSRASGKIYPRDNAYAGGLLKFLLREIFGKYYGNKRKNRKGGKKDKQGKREEKGRGGH
ncbi:hypothetical protein D9757_012483 [Collybiopsis confluens]|uniref:Uncharacterized protein n=1 Tax=Collybiopsis confluens TaxID=2823264 RepID=A0A8H5LP26_9AGAR|nr:hypothetical protein D9757_012483 [Collybiopsis confluens]